MAAATGRRRARWASDRALLVVLILAATALRGAHLDRMSLWTDEGLSFYRATKSLAWILSGRIDVGLLPTHDVQPPLYFLLLAGWLRQVGVSTWTAKWLSLLASLPAVPLTWALGARLGGRPLGRVGALFMAASPVVLWYAQEVRHYTLLVTLGLLSVYGLVRGLGLGAAPLSRRKGAWLAAAVVAGAAMVWTHYLGFFLVAFELALVVAAVVAGRVPRRQMRWLGVAAAVLVLATLPLVPFAVQRLGLGPERDQHFVPLTVMALDAVRGFTFGLTVSLATVRAWVGALSVLALIGFVALGRKSWEAALALAGYLVVPVVGLFVLTFVKPVYMGVRHILVAAPAWYLLLAAAPASLLEDGGRIGVSGQMARPVLGLGIAALVTGGMLAADADMAGDTAHAKDDLRGLATYVADRWVEGDALVLSDPVLEHTLRVYLPMAEITSAPLPGDARPLDEQLEDLATAHDRLWLMTPSDEVARWLDAHLAQMDQETFPGSSIPVRVEAWEPPEPRRTPRALGDHGAMTPDASGGPLGDVALVGWAPSGLTAGAPARVDLDFDGAPRPGLGAALRLVDRSGEEVATSDHALRHGLDRGVASAEYYRAPHDLFVPVETTPGPATLELVLYEPETGATWPATGPLVLGTVDVAPPAPGATGRPRVPHALAMEGGGVRLVGYEAPAAGWRDGAIAPVTVWLTALSKAPMAQALRVTLRAADGSVAEAEAPLPAMSAGDVRRMTLPLRAAGVSPGPVALAAELLSSDGQPVAMRRGLWPWRRATVALASTAVAPVAEARDLPAAAIPMDASFADLGALAGYQLAGRVAPGASLSVTLYWRADGPAAPAQVSVQLLPPPDASDPRPVAQHDGAPAGGERPSTGWRAGEVVTDDHTLVLPAEVPAGEYTLAVAAYDPATGARRAVLEGGAPVEDGLARLTSVRVEGR